MTPLADPTDFTPANPGSLMVSGVPGRLTLSNPSFSDPDGLHLLGDYILGAPIQEWPAWYKPCPEYVAETRRGVIRSDADPFRGMYAVEEQRLTGGVWETVNIQFVPENFVSPGWLEPNWLGDGDYTDNATLTYGAAQADSLAGSPGYSPADPGSLLPAGGTASPGAVGPLVPSAPPPPAPSNVVRTFPQDLTDGEKAVARANINAELDLGIEDYAKVALFSESAGDRYLGPAVAAAWLPTSKMIGVLYRRATEHVLVAGAKLWIRLASFPYSDWSAAVEVQAPASGYDVRGGYLSDINGSLYVPWWANNGSACQCGIRKSEDGGTTWTDFATLPTNSEPVSAVADALVVSGTRWMVPGYRAPDTNAGTYNDYAGFWQSTDAGATWAWRTICDGVGVSGANECAITEMPDGSLVYTARTGSVGTQFLYYQSWDGGATWHTAHQPRNQFDLRTRLTASGPGQCFPDLAVSNGMLYAFMRSDNSSPRTLIVVASPNGHEWSSVYEEPTTGNEFMYGQWVQVPGEEAIRLIYSEQLLSNGHIANVVMRSFRPVRGTDSGFPSWNEARVAISDAPASGAQANFTARGTSGLSVVVASGVVGGSSGPGRNFFDFDATGKMTLGAASSMNFLHNGSPFTAVWVARFADVSGAFSLITSNGASSSNVGLNLWADNRSGVSIKALRWVLRQGESIGVLPSPVGSLDNQWTPGEWTAIYLIYSGQEWRLWVGGKQIAFMTPTVNAPTGNANHAPYIGTYTGLTNIGDLAGAAFFDRALSIRDCHRVASRMSGSGLLFCNAR